MGSNMLVDLRSKRMTPESHLRAMSRAAFVISPPGVGADCHRHWECMLVGCIPIIQDSPINEVFRGLPHWIVQDFNEVNPQNVERKYRELRAQQFDFSRLYAAFWESKIVSSTPGSDWASTWG